MESIRNLIDAVHQFKLTRRYDYPALFILLQTSITLVKFSFLALVFLAGFQYLNHWLNPEREARVASLPATQQSNDRTAEIASVPMPAQLPVIAQPARPRDVVDNTNPGNVIARDSEFALLLAADSAEPASDAARPAEVHYRARIQWTNIRRAPTAAAPIITSLSTDQRVRIVLQKGDWVQVQSDEVDTQNGYVLASLLEPVDPSIQ